MHLRRSASACTTLLALALPATAGAFSYESTVSDACHEQISLVALRAVRDDLSAAARIEPTEDERALIDDLMLHLPEDQHEMAAVSLLIGVRDVDLKGRGPTEIDQLAFVHGDPDNQAEHCLRRPEQDEPDGSRQALEECRQVIRDGFTRALEGLDAEGLPNAADRIDVTHVLALRGQITSPLPRFWVELGRAMHTLQDAYTHNFRTPDGTKITVVLNWVDFVAHELEEKRDGPQHIEDLDRCDDQEETTRIRGTRAKRASDELLRLALDTSRTKEQKLAGLEALLDEHLAYQDGCTFENAWCEAPEAELAKSLICGCSSTRGGGGGVVIAGVLVLLLATRKRLCKLACISVLALALAPGQVWAEEDEAEKSSESSAGESGDDAIELPGTAIMLHLAAAASFDNPAIAFVAAGRYRLGEDWLFGGDVEWNPWVTPTTRTFRAGAINAYATIIRQWPMKREEIKLRTTANLGTSILITDLVGAPAGKIGLLVGLSVLGVEWRISDGWYMVFDPAHLVVPVPQLKGAPFGYPQYRFTLGVQFGG